MALGNYELRSIQKIFSDTSILKVPFFQRPFSWKKTEQSQFIDDLFRVHEENQSSYFIGSIFLRENDHGEFLIIDGQQRITCATIFLSVIRDILRDNNDQRSSKIEEKYLFDEDIISGDKDY